MRRRVNGKSPAKPFWYRDKGNMAIVGRTFAVADLKHARFSGFAAWLLWAGVHIYFLIEFANRLLVMAQWAISFLTKQRGVRILPLAQAEMIRADSSGQTVVSTDAAFEPSAQVKPRLAVAQITTQGRGNEARSN